MLRRAMIAALTLAVLCVSAYAQGAVTPSGTAGTVVTTTGAVTAETTISIGTYAGQALLWVLTAFSVPIGGMIVGWFYKVFQRMGFDLDEVYRDRFQAAVTNAINAVAPKAAGRVASIGDVDVKSKLVRDVIAYLATNIPDTLKNLKIDPNSNAGKQVIEGRIEKAINDPTTPTPASVAPLAGVPSSVVNPPRNIA